MAKKWLRKWKQKLILRSYSTESKIENMQKKSKQKKREQNVDGFILITIDVTISHWLMMIKIMDPHLPKNYIHFRLFAWIPKENNVLIVLFFDTENVMNRRISGTVYVSAFLFFWHQFRVNCRICRARFGSRVWFENQFEKIERTIVCLNFQKQNRKRIFQFVGPCLVKWHVSCGLRRGIIILKTTFNQREGKQTK